MGKKSHHIIGNNSVSNKSVPYKNNSIIQKNNGIIQKNNGIIEKNNGIIQKNNGIIQKNNSISNVLSKKRFNIFRYFCLSYKIKPEKQNDKYEKSFFSSFIIEEEVKKEIDHKVDDEKTN